MAATTTAPAAPDVYGPAGRSQWLDIDWRAHQRWVDAGGERVNVIELGDGPPLVLVHGHSGTWANWLENIPDLARSRRVVAFDLPGFGHSPLPPGGVTITGWARITRVLLEALGIERTAVVGNSMGGFIAAELAIRHPESVERLVLVSAAGLSPRYAGLPKEVHRRRSVLALARITNSYARIPEARAETLLRRPRLRRLILRGVVRHPQRLPAELCVELIRGAGRPGAPFATETVMTYDFRSRVPEIGCPTLIVWGANDLIVPAASADRFLELIPDSRKVVFDDTGHVPMLERPARFNAELDRFLSE